MASLRALSGAARELQSSGRTVFARQPCDHIPISRELGQWFCVPPFRVVCLWRVVDADANVIGYRAPALADSPDGALRFMTGATEVPAGLASTVGWNAIRSGLQIEALTVASSACQSADRRSETADARQVSNDLVEKPAKGAWTGVQGRG